MITSPNLPTISVNPLPDCSGGCDRGTPCSRVSQCDRGVSQQNEALLDAPDHVLSTLESDGSRRWLNPRIAIGDLWRRRRLVAYALMVVFVAIPHWRINGKPAISHNDMATGFRKC